MGVRQMAHVDAFTAVWYITGKELWAWRTFHIIARKSDLCPRGSSTSSLKVTCWEMVWVKWSRLGIGGIIQQEYAGMFRAYGALPLQTPGIMTHEWWGSTLLEFTIFNMRKWLNRKAKGQDLEKTCFPVGSALPSALTPVQQVTQLLILSLSSVFRNTDFDNSIWDDNISVYEMRWQHLRYVYEFM